MTEGPRRLKDDSDFSWETGCDLSDEAFALGGYDLPSMRSKVLSATQPPSAGAPLKVARSWQGLGWWVGGSLVAAVGAWLALAPAESPETPPTQQAEAPLPLAPAPAAPPAVAALAPTAPASVEVRAPEATVVAPQTNSPRARQAPGSAPPAALEPPVAAEPAPAVEAPIPAPIPAPIAAPTTRSQLADELSAYDRALEASSSGRHGDAASAFRDYLARWPDGRLRLESEVGLLFELVALGDHVGVEALAARLADLPALDARREEILRVRAENLVWLRRCEDAIAIARELPSRASADVRRACR